MDAPAPNDGYFAIGARARSVIECRTCLSHRDCSAPIFIVARIEQLFKLHQPVYSLCVCYSRVKLVKRAAMTIAVPQIVPVTALLAGAYQEAWLHYWLYLGGCGDYYCSWIRVFESIVGA